MRTLAPARARCGERILSRGASLSTRSVMRVGGDVPALVGGRERELVRAGGEPRGRPGRGDASRRGERRRERGAVDRQLHEPERARLAERQRERDDAAHERVVRRRRRAEQPAPRGRAATARRRRSVSAPGAPISSACAASRSRTRCATQPAPPAAATSPHSSAAAPPTCGAAHDVPPQALTASDSGSPGVMRTFVGAAMSGLRRPSSVGPLGRVRLRQQRRRVERADRERAARVARRGELEAVIRVERQRDPCGSRA